MRNLCIAGTVVLLLITAPVSGSAQPLSIDPALLHQLQETINKQQQQLQQQSEQIKRQSEILKNLQQQITALQKPAPLTQPVIATTLQTAALPVISSGNDKIKLAISGQINRAFNITNDGSSTQVYPVDNDASNSRIRFVGTARINDDLTIGTRLEVAIAPDESSVVSQTNQAPGDYFNQRWAEISLTSKTFGKLSIGKGDTASNTTAEVDLSRTDMVQYANIGDISGGMLFREKSGIRKLTTLKVSDVFKDLDGLSRQSRLRYDSPRLFGFSIAASLVSGQRSDLALLWGGEGYGLQATGAFAVSNPKIANVGLIYDGSFSVLHTASGLNLTVSGGLGERNAPQDATNLYVKLGWLANFTKLGYTAFGADYTRSENMTFAGDRGYSIGGAVVQSFTSYATELYFQYRIYSLDRAAGTQPVADMNVGTFGARVKF
jgi:predicted porin